MPQNEGMPGAGQAGQMSIYDMQETGMNVIYALATIVTMPVESLIRPWFGTTYYPAPSFFLSATMLGLATAFFGVATGLAGMIPGGGMRGPVGLYGLGSFTSLFFLTGFVHSFRLWRRMIHMELEENSTFEGPPLPIFALLPKGDSFWFVRIIYEPVLVAGVAIVLGNLRVIQFPLQLYLEVAALFLAMKQYISWYRTWAYIRHLMDMANVGPVIAKIVNRTATDDELARVHLASLPKNLPPDMHKATVAHLARDFMTPEQKDERAAPGPNPESGSSGLKVIFLSLLVAAFLCLSMIGVTGYDQIFHRGTRERTLKPSPFPSLTRAQAQPVGGLVPGAAQNPAFARLAGFWQGRGYFRGRGLCVLKLELRPRSPSEFMGFSSLTCASFGQRMATYPLIRAAAFMPMSAILSGTVSDGSVHFLADKVIDVPPNGCAMRTLTVTPFGMRQIAVEWQDGCPVGQLILQRANQ